MAIDDIKEVKEKIDEFKPDKTQTGVLHFMLHVRDVYQETIEGLKPDVLKIGVQVGKGLGYEHVTDEINRIPGYFASKAQSRYEQLNDGFNNVNSAAFR
tara:strand:- start:1754 stop:2050 length:297 start_codon:yes stop_codon:yes gene_type:complete